MDKRSTLAELKEEADELYAAIAELENRARSLKEKLSLRGIDSFRAEETVLSLVEAQGRLSRQLSYLELPD